MRITFTAVYGARPEDRRHIVVDCVTGATGADLARALGAARLSVDGRSVAPDKPIGAPPFVHGAVLDLRPDRESAPRGVSPWELWASTGPDAGLRWSLPIGHVVVGRSGDVQLNDPNVSRRHLRLESTAHEVRAWNAGGTNGTQRAGIRLSSTAVSLAENDVLELGSTRLVVRRARRPSAAVRPDGQGHLIVAHRLRAAPAPEQTTVPFPDPPATVSRSSLPVLALLVPLGMSAVLAAALHSPTMLLFGLTGPLLSLTAWLGERRRRRSQRQQVVQHRAAVAEASQRLAAAVEAEREALERRHGTLTDILARAESRSPELWSHDPGEVCVGRGSRTSTVRTSGEAPPACELHDAPLTVDLRNTKMLNLCGPRALGLAAAGAMIARLATGSRPADLHVRILVDTVAHAEDWRWASWLPHVEEIRVAGGLDDVAEEIERREVRHWVRAPPEPLLLVILDGWPALRGGAQAPDVLSRGAENGVVVLTVDTAGPPSSAQGGSMLEIRGPEWARLVLDGRERRVRIELPGAVWLDRLGRALAPLRATPASTGGPIPRAVRLLDLVPLHTPEELVALWQRAERSVRMTLGATADGPLTVDLRNDGPHALVAGTTGSGKSELLQTLVCSLALEHRPDELAFLLVDYKGGSAFRACSRLPHVMGVVTDLDGHLTARALTSLGAEIRRREGLLAAAGVPDLEGYHALRASALRVDGTPWPPLPRLVLVVDEFRVLAEELPDFVHGLVRLAAVGRSLGVHLVLSTQRPGGVVSADIRANVSLRIALRVRDRTDSMDVLDSQDAATLDAEIPGRAVVRGAVTPLTTFQAARVTGRPDSRARLTVTTAVPWRTVGRSSDTPPSAAASAEPYPPFVNTDLDAIVQATSEAATRMGIRTPAPPWLPPLPEQVDPQALDAPPGLVAVGLEDDPAAQSQQPWTWDPQGGSLGLGGGPRSGRTTGVVTVAVGIARATSPADVHVYVLGPQELRPLLRLPHVATVADIDDAEDVELVLATLRTVVADPERHARVVLLVDGWERLAVHTNGGAAAEVKGLLQSGQSSGTCGIVTGGRAVLAGQLSSLLASRLVLSVADPVELALAGIPAKAVPRHQPPGRAIDARSHREVHVAAHQTDGLLAVLDTIASAWAHVPDTEHPRPIHRLPSEVTIPPAASSRARVVVGVREADLEWVGLEAARGDRRHVVVGAPRSGRTTALATMAAGMCSAGYTVVGLGQDLGSRLDGLGVTALDGRRVEDRELLIAARRSHDDLALLVDDAERLAGSPIEPVLLEIARLVDEAGGLVVAATSALALEARNGALATELARAHTGLVLGAGTGRHLLGAPISAPTGFTTPPGRGLLVTPRGVERIQVGIRPPG